MRISDWSSDVCSSDLLIEHHDHEITDRRHYRTEQDRALIADHPVGDVAAEDRSGVHQRQKGTVGAAGIRLTAGIATKELRHDVQGQRPAHAVEGKALPELGDRKSTRLNSSH